MRVVNNCFLRGVQRTGWSHDHRFWRCACDQDVFTLKWVIHDKAFTRCIYPPRPMR
jgi:hypothetical protein